MKRSLLQALGIILISGALGLGANAFRADGIPLIERWTDKLAEKQQAGGFPAVSLAETADALARNDAMFLDARDPDFYALGHIPGAVNLPVHDFDRMFPGLKDRIEAAPLVIVYCDGGGCEASVELTGKLFLEGIDRISVFPGGFQEWKESGQAVEKRAGSGQ
ncbi:MAG TPA: rhodanese-like domain-containing protein [Syntrophobacteria bacterium]|nr:rhodanese-like domain-containing protein [Syntrophobacteria bacterium]